MLETSVLWANCAEYLSHCIICYNIHFFKHLPTVFADKIMHSSFFFYVLFSVYHFRQVYNGKNKCFPVTRGSSSSSMKWETSKEVSRYLLLGLILFLFF